MLAKIHCSEIMMSINKGLSALTAKRLCDVFLANAINAIL